MGGDAVTEERGFWNGFILGLTFAFVVAIIWSAASDDRARGGGYEPSPTPHLVTVTALPTTAVTPEPEPTPEPEIPAVKPAPFGDGGLLEPEEGTD